MNPTINLSTWICAAPAWLRAPVLVAAAALLAAQGVPNRPVAIPSPAAAAAAKPAEAHVVLADQGLVTAAYLRQHHPEAVLGLQQAVRAGKAKPAQLRGLVGPQLQTRLATAAAPALSSLAIRRAAVAAGGVQGKAPGPWRTALSAHGISLNVVDHAPAALVFPDSWDNQTVHALLRVTSNTDGPLTATLGPRSPFTIESLTIYDGFIATAAMGMPPMRKIAQQVTHAPWTIMTNAGQDVSVKLAFHPHFDLFSFTAGLYKDTLAVNGSYWNAGDPREPSWSLHVPVSAMFNGIALDVILLADEWHPEVITDPSYYPSVPQRIPLGFHLINTRDMATGTLSAEGLPAGVSLQAVPVTVGKNQTKAVQAVLSIDRSSAFYVSSPREVPVPFDVVFRHDGKTVRARLDFTIFEGFHDWYISGKCGSSDFGADLFLTAGGDFLFSGNLFNTNLLRPVDVSMRGGFPGYQLINCVFKADANSSGSTSYGWNSAGVQSNYLTFIHQPLSLTVSTSVH